VISLRAADRTPAPGGRSSATWAGWGFTHSGWCRRHVTAP